MPLTTTQSDYTGWAEANTDHSITGFHQNRPTWSELSCSTDIFTVLNTKAHARPWEGSGGRLACRPQPSDLTVSATILCP